MAVVLMAASAPGCVPDDYGALHEYNDVWKGELVFDDGGSVPARLSVFATRWDEDLAHSYGDLYMGVYGALEIDGADVIVAGVGDASHWDTRVPSFEAYSPIEGREFVRVGFYDAITSGLAESTEYDSDYGAFLDASGAPDATARGDVEIVVERDGDEMVGVVLETGGEGYEEIVGEGLTRSYTRQIGTAHFRRLGVDAAATFPDDTTVLRAPFEYETVIYDADNWGYAIRTSD